MTAAEYNAMCSSAWLNALSKSIESAEKIKGALLEVDDRELAEDARLLQENLKELRAKMESASQPLTLGNESKHNVVG